jgi:hypothetical protein
MNLDKTDDDFMLQELDPFTGKYLYMIYYSKNTVDPEEYNQKYTTQYNILKAEHCPKHWAPSIFAKQLRIPLSYNVCPVLQATDDFWKNYPDYKPK